jgi:deoxyribodipyrimidine photo-lyase
MNLCRVRALNAKPIGAGPVVYWMSRDQRLRDNWALVHAMAEAKRLKVPFAIVFCVAPHFLGATPRHYAFMLEGLQALEEELNEKEIPFFVLVGDPVEEVSAYLEKHRAGLLVTDFSPLRLGRQWRERVAKATSMSCVEVDAHNIVPCWIASDHQEFAARTIRPKIHRHLSEFLEEFPRTLPRVSPWRGASSSSTRAVLAKQLKALGLASGHGYRWQSGERAAARVLGQFIKTRLASYDKDRNIPTIDGQSELSPYLHFGQLSAERVALAVQASSLPHQAKEVFLEELIVRRELAENYCFYNPLYDSTEGFPKWARRTLDEHRDDPRPYVYTRKQFELGKTHDALWNACQREMVVTGKMHGYMRMYWAKKILEWTKTPEEAQRIAIYLNDAYELDGRDPNGYTGIAWSIGGVHDRPWFRRPIFGMVRYMSEGGAKSKFDVDAYIEKWSGHDR